MCQLAACVLGFDHLKCLYYDEEDFEELYSACQHCLKGDFSLQVRFLFKGTHLCSPKCSSHELLLEK